VLTENWRWNFSCVCLCSNDACLLEKNKPRPVPTSVVHAPLPTQQFGVDLELLVIYAVLLLLTSYVNTVFIMPSPQYLTNGLTGFDES